MLIRYSHWLILMFWTLISTKDIHATKQSKLIVVPIQSISIFNHSYHCKDDCSIDYCLKYSLFNKNCTKLKRDPCDCCNVCLRNENDICGGKFHIYGICEDDLICYQKHSFEQKGICVKACEKYQCLLINKSKCECATRRVPCSKQYQLETCEKQTHSRSYFKKLDEDEIINCSNIICPYSRKNSTLCPSDSHFVEDHTPRLRSSYSHSHNLTSICCEPRGHCTCSSCPKTICGENSIMQIYRIGNVNLPGQCCDQYQCITNSKQCHHDKKIYNEDDTWTLDQCTTCTCRAGLVDCQMIQCPTYKHCGYMYKPENECCPKCGGCLNDRFHVQYMNSTWIESNGCMRCYCENGRSRCVAEGCIAPPCENPRQIANVCCPVCDVINDSYEDDYSQENQLIPSHQCPSLDYCHLVCEHGLRKDEDGCFQCACSTMSCPSPLCSLKFDELSKQYCLCLPPLNSNCKPFQCEKHCPYNYSIDSKTGCPQCACNPCPQLICTKNCTYGLKRNEVGCPICVCQSNLTLNNDLILHTWNRQCQSNSFSYSNGEIWFDGCRQCFCHKGEQLCALISCPIPKCSQPIFLPNRCCPSCPNVPLLPEPIPSSQVCYASQYVTGEELEFDKCTKCICLHNIAFCSVSLCPPLSCSIPIYDASLCCPVCPSSDSSAVLDLSNTDENVCILDNDLVKHAGEVWKNNDCQSCLCPRSGSGQIECYSQMCEQNLPCSNPVLKRGQCCPFCLPPTAAVAVCIFNYIQYRSGEHWNVSECHLCECSLGTIVCHQHKCPLLTCFHTVTLPGHCCPICRDQLTSITNQNKLPISSSRFGFSVLILFFILILILILVILILIYFLIRGGHRSFSTSNQIGNHSSGIVSNPHHSTTISYGYNRISKSNELNPHSINPLPRTSTQSIIETNSSTNELERITFDEDDTLILQCSTSSNDDDYQHELNSTDNDESHPTQYQQILAPTSTFIYV